ncbi:MAG: hypothetical protein NTV54_14630 [Ignavibacteriales bacterium]|nr:hypothetical protein [Ignavibacteriales bacterium]
MTKQAAFSVAFFIAAISLLLPSCSTTHSTLAPFVEYGSFERTIPIPEPMGQQRERFNASIPGMQDSVIKNDSLVIRGTRTVNKTFLNEIIAPILAPRLDLLRGKRPAEIINALALFGHEIFRTYFGKDFYRWGGDINDLDDPQERGVRIAYRYGLDCSGFASLPYELAVCFGLIDSTSEMALFSSTGFARFCQSHNFRDRGGRSGTSNRYRLDTDDLHRIGREIFSVPRGGSPTDNQLRLAQPGDIVIRNGHVGLLVMIENELYYLESGGWVVPRVGGFPCHAREAIAIFAKNGPLSIRRCLPDLR